VTCSRCGAELPADSRFCPRCGAAVEIPATPERPAAEAAAPEIREFEAPATLPATPAPAEAFAAPPAAPPLRYAGFWRRFWAVFIDGIVLNVAQLPITFIVWMPYLRETAGDFPLEPDFTGAYLRSVLAGLFFGVLISWFYSAFLESSARQATLGKLAMGLRVTDLEGRRLGFGRASGRYFAHLISSLTLFVGYLVQPFTERRQALHDLVAGTLVVRG
jgi:uncharacterized RDD family membrane protein YckC